MVRSLAMLTAFFVAGCAQSQPPDVEVSHVHGLAYDAGTLYMATHHGLARGERTDGGWAWSSVGDRYDYMGFTQDANRSGTLYTSGHPDDPRAYGGVHLGLRRSTDGGMTWEQRSLKGEADFHALTSLHGGEGWLAGSWQGATKVSRDGGLSWTDHASPPAPVLALASASGALFAGTGSGLYRTGDLVGFGDWTRLDGPSQGVVSSVATTGSGSVILAGTGDGRSGSAYRSTDGGATWTPLDHRLLRDAPGQVHFAFERGAPSHAFAALGDGRLLESTDAGATWEQLR